jgi:hypothetical protein
MNISSYYYRNTMLFRVVAGILCVSAVLFFVGAPHSFAQNASSANDAQFRSAFQDLSRITGQAVSTKAQAKALCNQEKYLTECAEIGKRHGLFNTQRVKQVDAVLEEFKGKAVEDLKKCQSAECLVGVANELSSRLAKSAPDLANQLDLTSQKIEEKKAIIEAAKEVGVDPLACRDMNPDAASLDMLRGCARLAKHERVRSVLPEAARRAAEFNDGSVRLEESLERKEYQCGDDTAEGCGNFCLKPAESASSGDESAIPPVCRAIAERFFGAEGVRRLEAAYKGVKQTAEAYAKRAEHAVFTTHDGAILTDPAAIGRYLEEEGRKGNVEAVEGGLDFMVAKGFVRTEEKEFALGMVRKARERGGLPDFEACSQNVSLCEDFVPDAQKEEFQAFQELERTMREEVGFNPRQCREGGDEQIARRCIEGSKRALDKLEALGTKAPALAGVIANVRHNVERGEEFLSHKDEIQKTFALGGGPGGCGSETECRQYCSDPAHGPECIAFGAKNEISGFKGQEAVERFQEFHAALERPQQGGAPGQTDFQFPGQGPFPGFQPPGQGGLPPGQISGFQESRPGFDQSSSGDSVRFTPSGPSPECFAAIRAGDFVKAKEVCEVRFSGPVPPAAEQICPFVPHEPCAQGQYRLKTRDEKGCAIAGECVPIPGYKPEAHKICPAMPTVDECPADSERVASFSSPDCGTYYRCVPKGDGRGDGGSDKNSGAGGAGGGESIVPRKIICPRLPTVEECPAGQHKAPTFSSPECGTYYRCEPEPAFSGPPYQSPRLGPVPSSTTLPSPTYPASPMPYVSPKSPYSPEPAFSPAPTRYPEPTYSPRPTYSPMPTTSSQPPYSPAPTHAPAPTYSYTPQPTYTPMPTQSSAPSPSASPIVSPATQGASALSSFIGFFTRWFR